MLRKVPPERFHRLFYPQVPAVVTASHGEGIGALLATSVNPISINPPTIGLALGKDHRTTKIVELSKCFAVCWLSYETVERFQLLALPTSPAVVDKLQACGFSYRWGEVVKAPVIDEAMAWIEAILEWSREAGDHVFYAGKVMAAYAVEDFDEYWGFRRYKPILYVGSARSEWPKFVKFPSE